MIEDKFDLTYYSGMDMYSDGDVEEELLSAAADKENSVEAQLMKGNSWAHLYHLSPVRENILDWYDFDPKGSLLEIGSGCGALSGLFCSRVDHVVAIELSKRRSAINATRNEKYDNLKIMLGNFEDIRIEEKFDYVTLIGVFEYSICYINSEDPFMDMLKRVKSFLKPGGKLFIAIENKYGLKYFSGASEDHSGRLFDGIENYAAVDRVRTFSRKTLEKMLKKAGFTDNAFYYPMPDYKLPSEIYSDEHLPSFGSIRNACTAYDRDRYELFDERLAFDSICEDEMFEDFANSFLVISSNEGQDEAAYTSEKVLYAKYNRMRAPEYQISTRIIEGKDGTKRVEKTALRPEAEAHIDRLEKNYELLSRTGTLPDQVCPIELHSCGGGRAVFPFIKGEGLSRQVDEKLCKPQKAIEILHHVLDRIYPETDGGLLDFVETDDFKSVFGDDTASIRNMKCHEISNVDCILSNFVIPEGAAGEKIICLDYEWVFDFPIPADYLKYRTLFYYYSENQAYFQKYICEKDFLAEFGIDETAAHAFAAMDDHFQQYVHGAGHRYMYMKNYARTVTNIGKNFQNNEPWFQSVMSDLNRLNHTIGPNRRDLVSCHIKMHRKSEAAERWKYRFAHPGSSAKSLIKKIIGRGKR